MSIRPCSEPECEGHEGSIELVIGSRAKDLGEFEVRRVLPASERQRVGPFIFFDHMGPATFAPGSGVAVRPHPHIGLATVTYLFAGVIRHRDSLGSDQAITPGAVNWMTAGRGIVHSERTPEALLAEGSTVHGLQVWLALPREAEESEPGFVHHPAETIPRIESAGVRLSLIAGEAAGQKSPVVTGSQTLYLAGELEAGAELAAPEGYEERAVYVVEGELELDGEAFAVGTMVVLRPGAAPRLRAKVPSRVAVVGGAPIEGERILWWNFVSSSRERLEQAKADWKNGRFPAVPGDPEFIPLPEE
jgi:redox-sensitive bicupin YhaK (pirin superfamily)